MKNEDQCWKCWGYEKKGTQKLFGKTYNRCVKKEETQNESASFLDKESRKRQSLEDSTKKDASLTKEKILDLTLRHRQQEGWKSQEGILLR